MIVKLKLEKRVRLLVLTQDPRMPRGSSISCFEKNRLGWGQKIIGNINVMGEGGGGAMGGTTMLKYYDYLPISVISYRHKKLCFDT